MQTFKLNCAKILSVVFLMIISCLPAQGSQVSTINVVIKDVVYETEEGFVSTDKGSFMLPESSTEIEMDPKTYDLLITNLKLAQNKPSTLYIYDNTVVGIVSEGLNFKPEYKKRQKKVYTSPPKVITTTMESWDRDTYRLSINTKDGIFCVPNDFEYKDYYEKVHKNLQGCCKENANINTRVTIKYHKVEDSDECPGEVEDIEIP